MDTLVIGILQRSHGVRGHMRVKSCSGETDHFRDLEWVLLRKNTEVGRFSVEDIQVKGRDIFLKLEGIDSPEQASAYLGWEVLVPRDKGSPLRTNQYYVADLCRCSLFWGDEAVGRVVSVIEGNASFLLEIQRPSGHRVLVPFVEAWIGKVDIDKGYIELKDPLVLE